MGASGGAMWWCWGWSDADAHADATLFRMCLYFHYISSLLTFIALQFIPAPYGKHSPPRSRSSSFGWGPTVHPTLAWALMESPTIILSLLIFPLGLHRSSSSAMALISFFLFHYLHRTCLYPLYLKSSSASPLPLSIPLLAFVFNSLNAYVQARSISHYAYANAPPSFSLPHLLRFGLGSAVFLLGFAINVWSDRVLVGIKRQGKGYRLPRGGLFELVSSPNYFGEVVEWLGWAIMCWSWASLAFLLSTCANLVPRARAHRQWYLDKFPDEYPLSRKAIVPFLY